MRVLSTAGAGAERFWTGAGRRLAGPGWLASHRRDLAATGRSPYGHTGLLTVAVLIGTAFPGSIAGLLSLAGWHLPIAGTLAATVAGSTAGVLAPLLELHRSAEAARTRLLRAVSCWLELVALAQAGGMGVESAVDAACAVSPDPDFARIRQAIDRARHAGSAPFEELGRLGEAIGVTQLVELAASLTLAGAEGARVRSSLRAKASSLRHRQLAEAQARANAVTERMFLPSVVLMLGFLMFITYPAGVSLLHVV